MPERWLQDGPLAGEVIDAPSGMLARVPIQCPWGDGMAPFHFASADYDAEGRWVETRCTSTDGEPLVRTPSDTTAGQDGDDG